MDFTSQETVQTQAAAANQKARVQEEQIQSDERTAVQQTLQASHAQHAAKPAAHNALGSMLGGFSSLVKF